METRRTSFFEGVPPEVLRPALEGLQQRSFHAGEALIEEGSVLTEMFVILRGTADIWMVDRLGEEHPITRQGPGTTLGDISVITGQPATATCRAATDMEVLVLTQADFQRLGERFPRIHHNLTRILSERLVRASRQQMDTDRRRCLSMLIDHGAPASLGYALACSVAWHSRGPTLHLILSEDAPPVEVADIASAAAAPLHFEHDFGAISEGAFERGAPSPDARAHMLLAPPTRAFAAEAIAVTLDDLCEVYDHILLQVPANLPLPHLHVPTLNLAGMRERPPTPIRWPECHTVQAWSHANTPGRPNREGVLEVPPLTRAEEEELDKGRLSAGSAAGKALGWAARHLTGTKVGLALGSGTERGYAHIGVLKVLEQAGLPVDYLAGTSIGSAIAAAYATGYTPEEVAGIMDRLSSAIFKFALPITSLLSNAELRLRLSQLTEGLRIEEVKIPLAIVAADMVTRREIVFRRGLLLPALLASMAIPGIYPAQCMGPYTLVDGGVLNPVPGNVACDMGADVVIAVKLPRPPTLRPVEAEAVPTSGRSPSMAHVISRTIEMMQSKIASETASKAEILIEPEFTESESGGFGLRDFSRGRAFTATGEAAAEAALPRIAVALPWLRT